MFVRMQIVEKTLNLLTESRLAGFRTREIPWDIPDNSIYQIKYVNTPVRSSIRLLQNLRFLFQTSHTLLFLITVSEFVI